jgi:hypothetical protein
VGPPLLDKARYHCPVIGFLNAPKPVIKSFKRKIWLYNQGDFDEYRRLLSLIDWESIFFTDDIDKITTDISNTILSAAEATIPNKTLHG